jgi:hypothetical protein
MDRLILVAVLAGVVVAVSLAIRWATDRHRALRWIDPDDLGDGSGGRVALVFTSPYCHGCKLWVEMLGERGIDAVTIDVSLRPDLAARYKINSTPRVAVVRRRDGEVLRDISHYTPREHDLDAVSSLLVRAGSG